jgi:choline monooxygenase
VFEIHPDISKAHTPPSEWYTSTDAWSAALGAVFARSWQWIADADHVAVPGSCHPAALHEHLLDDPVVLIRDHGDCLRLLSNTCTHRGNLVVQERCIVNELRCRYHGRRFALDGSILAMPEFGGVENFPCYDDNLRELPSGHWAGLVFGSSQPATGFDSWIDPLTERLAHLPLQYMKPEPSMHRDYVVRAHWALYVENYLEGFHIPFVHAGLNRVLDYSAYQTVLSEYGVLQIGIGSTADAIMNIPERHIDAGRSVAAWYFWLWPNTMINVYPWGVSMNIVQPLTIDRTRIRYRTYVWDESQLGKGAGADLDRVEREDGAIVESVQRGLRSSVYSRGRYSPTKEQGVHHFHRLLARALSDHQ